MPARLLREGILDSDRVSSLTFPAEVFYRRLMSVVDDFGRFDGRPAVLRSRLYPVQIGAVTESDVSGWVSECEAAGLIARYTVSGKPYIQFFRLGLPRAKESKYPDPPPELLAYAAGNGIRTPSSENDRVQVAADAPVSGTDSDAESNPRAHPIPTDEGGLDSNLIPTRLKKAEHPASKPPASDALFQAIAEATGRDPATDTRALQDVWAVLSEANPSYTADDVRAFASQFWKHCPWAAKDNRQRPTPKELQSNIGLIRAAPAPAQTTAGGLNRSTTCQKALTEAEALVSKKPPI